MVRDAHLVRIGFQNNVTHVSPEAVYVEMGKTWDGDTFGAWFPKSATRVGSRGEIMVPAKLLYQHKSNVVETPASKYRSWY